VFPIRDENPTVRTPIAVIVLIGLNVASWVYLQGLGSQLLLAKSVCVFGLMPGELLGTVPRDFAVPVGPFTHCVLDGTGAGLSVITSMFMHGGWFHIIGNLWFLWLFGDNVEDVMGATRFVVFYLLCGLAAAAAHVATAPDSVVPMVGASGAIGGVMGAYARLYPRAHVHTVIFLGIFFTTVSLPAFVMLGFWFLLQVLGGMPTLAGVSGNVAFWAHVGGFVAGVVLVGLFKRPEYLEAHRRQVLRQTARHRVR